MPWPRRRAGSSWYESEETEKWGKPHFCVAGKIFAGCGEEGGVPTLGFKLAKEAAVALIASDSRVSEAPYVGRHGWVTMELRGRVPWRRVEGWIRTSWTLVAPKRLL